MVQVDQQELDRHGGNAIVWLRFTLLFVLLCGGVYPVVTTRLGHALFPYQAGGSLIEQNGVVVGSELIGQPFGGESYFIPRPSAAGDGYDPTGVSGSNLATSNPDLRARAEATSQQIAEREGVEAEQIPVDLIAASGSGVDPHISPEAARLQASRVAEARGLDEAQVLVLIAEHTQRGLLGLGNPGVNVLRLNLALNTLEQN
jgi:K+-transporting ATPase ATPase C chain